MKSSSKTASTTLSPIPSSPAEERNISGGVESDDEDENESQLVDHASHRGSWSSIAHRVERSLLVPTTVQMMTTRRHHLWNVILTLIFSLVFVNGVVYIVNELVISAKHPDLNTKKNFDYFENSYKDIIEDTVPFIQDWYRNLKKDEPLIPVKSVRYGMSGVESDCLGRWFADIKYIFVPNGGEIFTRPQVIERILESMGLSQQPLIREHLDDLLHEPHSLESLLDSAFGCLNQTKAVKNLACAAEIAYPSRLSSLTSAEEKSYLLDTLHVALALDRLTNVLMTDFTSLHQVADTMQTNQYLQYEDYIKEVYGDSPAKVEFRLAKYRGVANFLQAFATGIAQNEASATPTALMAALQTNILEAVKLDAVIGHENNARVGLALASAVRFGPHIDKQRYLWGLGKDWVDVYSAWNIAFVAGSLPLQFLWKLTIPAISCTLNSNGAEHFIAYRTFSLALSLMLIHRPLFSGLDGDNADHVAAMELFYTRQTQTSHEQFKFAAALGKTNFEGSILPIPSTDSIEKMLYDLCAGQCHKRTWKAAHSNPSTGLNDDKFQVYLGFVLWITVLLAGLGLELLVLLSFLQDGWSPEHEVRWRFAQFLFPLLAAVTLGLALEQNALALLTLVPGLWKFGFPETIMYVYHAMYKSKEATNLQKSVEFFNGVGIIIHHGAASLVIVMLLSGSIRPEQSIINPILILLMQHWFVLLKYVSTILYIVLELVLEIWFEWVVISEMEEIFANNWTAALGANCMLVAHWLFIACATLALFEPGGLDTSAALRRDNETRAQYLESFRRSIRIEALGFSGRVMRSMRSFRLNRSDRD